MDGSITRVDIRQLEDYRFELNFGTDMAPIIGDEPAPLGTRQGPSPVQLLAAAVGNCLCDSLLFALRKFEQAPEPLSSEVQAYTGRNAEGRMRVVKIEVDLKLGVPVASLHHMDRILSTFESYCTVSQSIAQGIPVVASVRDSDGLVLSAAKPLVG